MRNTIPLHGNWTFRVPGGQPTTRKVPGSYYLCGDCMYSRDFSVQPQPDKRYLLVFEGILYGATPTLNGTALGKMLPYSRYRFDVTKLLTEGVNHLEVAISDLSADYGPTLGWRNYAGIVRDVYLLEMEQTYVEDVFFYTQLSNEYSLAHCFAEVTLSGAPDGASVQACLSLQDRTYRTEGVCKDSKVTLGLRVDNPMLWSPDSPTLYTLCIQCGADSYEMQVGIREFIVKGNRFLLNGNPCFLAGVCRHDMQTDAGGYTQTDEEIERDMRTAKNMGANFVRLVHYPHDERVVMWADRLGLMVSEEPGAWGEKMEAWTRGPLAIEVMKNVVRRDRSHPSLIFWLTFNECFPTLEYLKGCGDAIRELDPTRPVSGANFMRCDQTKELFDAAGYDFYTYHPYGRSPELVSGGASINGKWELGWHTMEQLCRLCPEKPVVFTEWGGFYVSNNPNLFEEFVREMLRLGKNPDGEPVLAGMSYWSWADIYEANRPYPACTDGILTEGLVTLDRQPKGNYQVFMELLKDVKPPYAPQTKLTFCGTGVFGNTYTPIPLPDHNSAKQENAWAECVKMSLDPAAYSYPMKWRIDKGPALPYDVTRLGDLQVCMQEGLPYVLNHLCPEMTVSCDLDVSALYFIGNCTLSKGYPIDYAYGEELAEYILEFADGSQKIIPLRNGMELTTAWGLYGSSPIDPRGCNISRAFSVSHDLNWEVYHVNIYRVKLDQKSHLRSITCRMFKQDSSLLLYGISAE